MSRYQRALVSLTIVGSLFFAWGDAVAAELGNVCWMTDAGTLLRFSVSEAGQGHYTYTGIFNDTDGGSFAISGHVESAGGTLIGSFSGSKSTADNFKTAIYSVTFNSGTFAGTAEGIRQRYDRATTSISTDYRVHTLTPTACP